MTKRDLVLRISEESGLELQQLTDLVQLTLDHMARAVAQGRKLEIRNFGIFEVRLRKARMGRNPKAPGKNFSIPERAVVKFKAGKDLREAVLKLTRKEIAEARAMDHDGEKTNRPPS